MVGMVGISAIQNKHDQSVLAARRVNERMAKKQNEKKHDRNESGLLTRPHTFLRPLE